jgi:hypothetical protein
VRSTSRDDELEPGTASGCGVREDAPGKCRRVECDASGNEISSSVLEASKFRKREKYRTNFHVTDAHTKRDVEKVTNKQKRPLSFVGLRAARRFRLPPFFLFAFPKLAVKTTPNSDMRRKNGQTLDARR